MEKKNQARGGDEKVAEQITEKEALVLARKERGRRTT
jgi:hypothetical protein